MEFITKNGQKSVKINIASFKDTMRLKRQAVKCLSESNITDSAKGLKDIGTTTVIDKLLNILINADMSEEFEDAVFACLSTCIYDDKYKINPQLFDDIKEAREDYYEIVSKCIEENLRPFFKSLVSELKARLETTKFDIPELELPQMKTSV